MPAVVNESYSKTYNSFSGCDIQATFAGIRIAEVQGISFTVMREKAPLYTMGSADCRGYSRGKRGISGSLIFLMFDRNALLRAITGGKRGAFVSPKSALTQSRIKSGATGSPGDFNRDTSIPAEADYDLYDAWYPDQIPPFTVVLNAVNEYGHGASMAIHGVEILNHGSGISIDDITIDESMTFVATVLDPWKTYRFINPASVPPAV